MKYKVGDYIAAPHTIYFKIAATLEGEQPIYGITSVRSKDSLVWYLEGELDNKKMVKKTPDFEQFKKARPGDFIMAGDVTVKVLAVAGNAILISDSPSKMAKHAVELADQLSELAGEDIMDEETRQKANDHISPIKSMNRAEDWHDMEWLTLMNWELLGDE